MESSRADGFKELLAGYVGASWATWSLASCGILRRGLDQPGGTSANQKRQALAGSDGGAYNEAASDDRAVTWAGQNAKQLLELVVECKMIDISTKKPLYVSTDGDAGPYIMVPVRQINDIRALLDANNIAYWVDEEAISLDGKPEVTVVNLRQGTDPATVQRILDGAP